MIENIPVFIYTFLACFSFCFIFKFHKLSHMIAAATGGMLSWVFYVACAPLGNDLAQYLISTIIVSAYAEVMARVFKAPVTGFLTIGILPLVPGGGIYYTMAVSYTHLDVYKRQCRSWREGRMYLYPTALYAYTG